MLLLFCNVDDLSEARLRALWAQQAVRSKPQNGDSATSGDAEPASESTSEETQNDNGAEGDDDETESNLYSGFDDEPFVQAAAHFLTNNYHGILELLSKAVDEGELRSEQGVSCKHVGVIMS